MLNASCNLPFKKAICELDINFDNCFYLLYINFIKSSKSSDNVTASLTEIDSKGISTIFTAEFLLSNAYAISPPSEPKYKISGVNSKTPYSSFKEIISL